MKGKQDFFLMFLVVGLFFVLISPYFLTDGMFLDGLWYATISKNMSEGFCSFWTPKLTQTRWAWGQPPMAFLLQAPFFLISKNLYIAKIYSVLTYICTGSLMFGIWKEIGENFKYFWFVILLWITIPLVYWGATNNVLENTMSIFVMLSILLYLKSLRKFRFPFVILSGLMLFFAFLTKGFTGLYPLVFPFLHCLFLHKRKLSATLVDSICIFISLVLPLFILYLFNPEAKHFFDMYMSEQVVNSLNNVRTVDNRFFIVLRFFEEILVPLILVVIIVLIAFKQNVLLPSLKRTNLKLGGTFFALTLSGVLPMMISLKQSGFYIITVFPIFAIALGIAIQPILEHIYVHQIFRQVRNVFSILLLIFSVVLNVYFAGKVGKDKEMLADIHLISEKIPENTIIDADTTLHDQWSMIAYFYFNKKISIDFESKYVYYLCDINNTPIDSTYTLIVKGTTLQLFQKP